MRILLIVIGLLAMAMGILWVFQGLGIVEWPKSSLMLGQTKWAVNGVMLTFVGLGLVWFGRGRL